jgi:hypothetical protein
MASIVVVAQMATLATAAILMLICLFATTRGRGDESETTDQDRPDTPYAKRSSGPQLTVDR